METTENQRFIEVVKKLVELRKEKSLASYARKLGMTSQYFSDLKSEKMKVSVSILDRAEQLSSINRGYIVSGKGDMFLADPSTSDEDIFGKTKMWGNMPLPEKLADFLNEQTRLLQEQIRVINSQQEVITKLIEKIGDKNCNSEEGCIKKTGTN